MIVIIYLVILVHTGTLYAYCPSNPRLLAKNTGNVKQHSQMSHDSYLAAPRQRCHRSLVLKAASETPQTSPKFYINLAIAFIALPASAELLPALLAKVTDFSVEPMERQKYIIGLLLFKRMFLYITAIVGVDWCAKRSASDRGVGLGERLGRLNEEIFDGLPAGLSPPLDDNGNEMTLGTSFNTQAAPLLGNLDEMEGKDQALALPVLVGASLLASFAWLQASKLVSSWLASSATVADISEPILDPALQATLSQLGPVLSAVVAIGVCSLFSKAEIQQILSGVEEDYNNRMLISNKWGIATLLAVIFSGTAVVNPVITKLVPPSALWSGLGLWPLANTVNLLVGVTISRAFILPSLLPILLALVGLVAYDAFFVLGTQALTDGGQGIMEAVAMAKLQGASSAVQEAASSVAAAASSTAPTSGTIVAPVSPAPTLTPAALGAFWKPGLLTVSLNGKVSDALGLGDVIFPSLLAGWALRFDNRANRASSAYPSSSFYGASLGGYALGCLLCELLQTGAGQPALLYVVPAMVLTMSLANAPVLLNKEALEEVLTFDGE